MKSVYINKNSSKKININSDLDVLSFEELIGLIRNFKIHRHLFKYKKSVLLTYKIRLLSKPLLTSIILLTLSPFNAWIEDDEKKSIKVNIYFLFIFFINFFKCWSNKNVLLDEVLSSIERIEYCNSNARPSKTRLMFRPVYVRTDICFNVLSGGSVGHIAGVLNNLHHFTGEPLFLTSDSISTVSPEKNRRNFKLRYL